MGFKSPPSRRRPPKDYALKYLLRASEPRLNIMFVSPPIDSPRAIDVASCPTKACIPASQLLHATKIAELPKTDFLENSVGCEPLCAYLCFCDLAIRSKFDAEAVK
jgi:hypothetical protein